MENFAEGISGALGGAVGRSIAFPFETLKLRKTLDPSVSTLSVFTNVKELYRGLFWSALEAFINKGIQMFVVTKLRLAYVQKFNKKADSLFLSVIIGYMSDLCVLWSTIPLENVVARMQKDPQNFSFRKEILTVAFAKQFMQQLPIFLILSWKPGLEIGIFDRIKSIYINTCIASTDCGNTLPSRSRDSSAKSPGLPSQQVVLTASEVSTSASASSGEETLGQKVAIIPSLPPLQAFVFGALARMASTTVVYPYIFVKSLAISGDTPGGKKKSLTTVLLEFVKKEGLLAAYTGLGFEILRGVSQSATMFLIIETLRSRVRAVLQMAVGNSN